MKKTFLLILCMFFLAAGLRAADGESREINNRDLFLAIQNDNLELFQVYLDQKADWNATDGQGNTLIHALIAVELVAPAEAGATPGKVTHPGK
jgi:hypothetical protein